MVCSQGTTIVIGTKDAKNQLSDLENRWQRGHGGILETGSSCSQTDSARPSSYPSASGHPRRPAPRLPGRRRYSRQKLRSGHSLSSRDPVRREQRGIQPGTRRETAPTGSGRKKDRIEPLLNHYSVTVKLSIDIFVAHIVNRAGSVRAPTLPLLNPFRTGGSYRQEVGL